MLTASNAGVTQKYLIVTSNYHARARGVTKLQNIYDAKVPSVRSTLRMRDALSCNEANGFMSLLGVAGQVPRDCAGQRGGLVSIPPSQPRRPRSPCAVWNGGQHYVQHPVFMHIYCLVICRTDDGRAQPICWVLALQHLN